MKKSYILLAACLLSVAAWAQDDEVIGNNPVHYFNLSPKVGYAAGFDNLGKLYMGNTGDINVPYADGKVIGGWGAGLAFEYELELGHFLFDVGLDFDFTSATSRYDFGFSRSMSEPYNLDYRYRFFQYAENRNVATVGLPVRLGAQFGNFYFLLGAKVGYGIFGKYKNYGDYQVTAWEPTSNCEIQTNPDAGTGLFNVNKGSEGFGGQLALKPLDVRALAEFGLDLDDWLQAPVPKKKPKIKKGAKRKPFTKNDIHYRVGLFAEYDVLSINNQKAGLPTFGGSKNTELASMPSVLSEKPAGTPALNNLLAGVKFTVQFAIPEKVKRPGGGQAVPPSQLDIYVRDKDTQKPIEQSYLAVRNLKSGKMAGKGISIRNGKTIRKFGRGEYDLYFSSNEYYSDSAHFEASIPNSKDTMYIYLLHRPVLKVKVSDAETGSALAANVLVHQADLKKPIVLRTSPATGRRDTILPEAVGYHVTVDVKGYEPYAVNLQTLGDDLDIRLSPIKVGRTFVLKNMFFATNKTKILPESEEALQTLYEYLTDEFYSNRRIRIIGHTDNVGKDAANQKLSEGRAKAVREALIERGIDPSRIEAEGKGETQPIDTNDTEEGRQNNRRVEIMVLE